MRGTLLPEGVTVNELFSEGISVWSIFPVQPLWSMRTQRLHKKNSSLLLQLLEKIRQIKELLLRLNLPVLVEFEVTDTVEEEHVSALSRKT